MLTAKEARKNSKLAEERLAVKKEKYASKKFSKIETIWIERKIKKVCAKRRKICTLNGENRLVDKYLRRRGCIMKRYLESQGYIVDLYVDYAPEGSKRRHDEMFPSMLIMW